MGFRGPTEGCRRRGIYKGAEEVVVKCVELDAQSCDGSLKASDVQVVTLSHDET